MNNFILLLLFKLIITVICLIFILLSIKKEKENLTFKLVENHVVIYQIIFIICLIFTIFFLLKFIENTYYVFLFILYINIYLSFKIKYLIFNIRYNIYYYFNIPFHKKIIDFLFLTHRFFGFNNFIFLSKLHCFLARNSLFFSLFLFLFFGKSLLIILLIMILNFLLKINYGFKNPSMDQLILGYYNNREIIILESGFLKIKRYTRDFIFVDLNKNESYDLKENLDYKYIEWF